MARAKQAVAKKTATKKVATSKAVSKKVAPKKKATTKLSPKVNSKKTLTKKVAIKKTASVKSTNSRASNKKVVVKASTKEKPSKNSPVKKAPVKNTSVKRAKAKKGATPKKAQVKTSIPKKSKPNTAGKKKVGSQKSVLKKVAKTENKKAKTKKSVNPKVSRTETAAKHSSTTKVVKKKKVPPTKKTQNVKTKATTDKLKTKNLKPALQAGKSNKPKTTPKKGSSIKERIDVTSMDSNIVVKPVRRKAPASHHKQFVSVLDNQARGFTPYAIKKGEEYMNEAQKQHFRKILFHWRSELMEEVDRTVHNMKDEASNPPDPADRATLEEEFSIELRTRDRERRLIKKIDSTIEMIANDDYGYCESCGIEIGIRRLEARPTANKCIDCKTLDELKERQLGSA